MTATVLPLPDSAPRAAVLDLSPVARAAVGLAGVGLTTACLVAAIRFAAGLAPAHPNSHSLAVAVHLAAVLPAVPVAPSQM